MFSGRVLLICVLIAFAYAQDTAESLDNYMLAHFNQTNPIGKRSGAVIGSTSNLSVVVLLGGESSTGPESESYKFDIPTQTWTKLAANFTRTKACYSQDSNRNAIWIFGGISSGSNSLPFLAYQFDGTFVNFSAPPAGVHLEDASCLAAPDGSKFFAMFGETTPSDLEELTEGNCSDASPNVAVYDANNKNWTVVKTTGDIPSVRVGAAANLYNGQPVVFGGVCGDEGSADVYRLDLGTLKWTKDSPVGTAKPSGRGFVSSFISQDSLLVFGGRTSAAEVVALNDAWVYDLKAKNWTLISKTFSDARSDASTVALLNRAFVFGGRNGAAVLDDASQFVAESACLSLGCEDCTYVNPGCGWCSSNSKCVAGDNSAYIASTCNTTTLISDLDSCPQVFPSYGIALLVIGGVVVVGIIIFAIMKVRGGDEAKDGYEKIA